MTLPALVSEAEALWRRLPAGSVVWLSGEIGAGKTTFVQAVTRAAGATRATSPTYALVHAYRSPAGTIVHADCYRLRDPGEARDLDFDRLRRDARMLLIEWPERAGQHAPAPDARILLGHGPSPDTRTLELLP